jgi:hypothetical protein
MSSELRVLSIAISTRHSPFNNAVCALDTLLCWHSLSARLTAISSKQATKNASSLVPTQEAKGLPGRVRVSVGVGGNPNVPQEGRENPEHPAASPLEGTGGSNAVAA